MSLENKIQMLLEALEKNTDALLNAPVYKNHKPEVVVEEPEVVVEEPEVVVEEPEVVDKNKPSASIEDCRVIATYIVKVLKDKDALSGVLKTNGVTNLTAFSGDTDSFLKDLEDVAGVKLEDCPN